MLGPKNKSNINTNEIEEYLKAYIGANYDQVKKGLFSIQALIFGPIYLVYKKMYILGIFLLALLGIIYYYNNNIGFVINIALNFLLAFKFNSLYYENSIKRIDEIKISNSEKSEEELLEICRKKGKPLFALVVFIILIILILISMIPKLFTKEEVLEPIDSEVKELSYTVPKGYEKGEYDTSSYKTYHFVDDKGYCLIQIEARDNTNITDYIKTYFQEDIATLPEITLANEKWKLKKEEEINNYLIEKNNIVYHISYRANENSTCQKLEEEFTSSLTFQAK